MVDVESPTIGQYRVIDTLGEGGMGVVYRGEHRLLDREVAIKVLHERYTTDEGIVKRFFNEARAATQINDPGIVQVFDFGIEATGAYIIMERLEGEAIEARLHRIERFTPGECVRLMKMVCTSLHAAHAKQIFHRDLKPSNIFIVADHAVPGGERPKILDFGIAKLANDPGAHQTQANAIIGTPAYMSPEHCRGMGVDERSDIYSLGCVMMAMLTGRPPFESNASAEVLAAHLVKPVPPPSARVPGLPKVVDAIVLKALEKQPENRFQNVLDMAHALERAERIVDQLPTAAIGITDAVTSVQSPPTTMSTAMGETFGPAARRGIKLVAALAVLAIGVTILTMTRSRQSAIVTDAPTVIEMTPVITPIQADAAVPLPEPAPAEAEPIAPALPPAPPVAKQRPKKTAPVQHPTKPGEQSHARPDAVDRGD